MSYILNVFDLIAQTKQTTKIPVSGYYQQQLLVQKVLKVSTRPRHGVLCTCDCRTFGCISFVGLNAEILIFQTVDQAIAYQLQRW